MKKLSLCIAIAFIAGCATMPDPVKDEYLVNQTAAQKQKLNDLAQNIISKRKEKEKLDDELKITSQKLVIVEKNIPVLEREHDMLLEKQKLYTLENNEDMVSKTNEEISRNRTLVSQQKARQKYLKALENNQKALIDLRLAELAVLVADMEYEKSVIARVYQEKELGLTDKPQTDKDGKEQPALINITTYQDYLAKQRRLLASKTARQQKTAELLDKARSELRDAGVTEDMQ
jgi:hypothetical protein